MAPKRAKKEPKRGPEHLQEHLYMENVGLYQNSKFPTHKSRFLRFGGSAWELKFDTKRAQDKKNKHLEEDIERRNEQITNNCNTRS